MSKKQLTKEELEQVTGGTPHSWWDSWYRTEIDKYATEDYIGQDVLIKSDSLNIWIFGTLVRSWEKTDGCGTKRTARVKVKDRMGTVPNYEYIEVCLDECKIYIYETH